MTRRLTALKGLLITAVLLAAALLAGCHDIGGTTSEYDGGKPADATPDDEEGEDPGSGAENPDEDDPAENESQEPRRLELALRLAPVSGTVFTGDPVDLQVEVDAQGGSYGRLDWAGVRWSLEPTTEFNTSAPPEDHQSGLVTEDDPQTGIYNISAWEPGSATTYYLRAHLQADGHHYWSDEVQLEVTDPVEQTESEADVSVRMRTNLTDPCEGDTYSQDPLEIDPGTVVGWTNAANCDHTATHDAEDPLWNTGQIEPNNSSTHNYRFNKPGTYEVRCDYHPGMHAQIVVG